MKNIIGLTLCLLAFYGHADSAIRHVTYRDNAIIALHGKTLTTTQIVFSDDEVVMDVEGGDSSGWMVTLPSNLPNMVYIKPTVFGSDSNLTVVTNLHHYYFHVTSNRALDDDQKAIYALKFIYPKSSTSGDKAQNNVIKPQNWSYSFSGHPSLKPLHVFDDGRFTYIELQKGQPVPAVFVVDNRQGREAVVNTRQQGDFLVVLRTAPQFTLRRGNEAVASLFNQRAIQSIRQGRSAL